MKLQHYIKQTTNTLQKQINNTKNKQNHNKINAVSYNTVQGHPRTDEMVY